MEFKKLYVEKQIIMMKMMTFGKEISHQKEF
jgi:hypothetical protein